ncbi:MAG: 30S ribosome-binding factor RbfA [Hyphomicrobiaceae bacterium]|nr:30S ribosome-binding factor RbfA [Hyphomicrobiaceae bacterium]
MIRKHKPAQPVGPSQRQLRVGEMIRHALAELMARGSIHDETLESHLVTVSEVRMTADLKTATVYIVPLGGDDMKPVLEAFERNKKFLRGEVARAVNLKFAPDLRFRSDDSFEEGMRIDALLASPAVRRDVDGEQG